jgi:AmiR/NasT family two-component response regulator
MDETNSEHSARVNQAVGLVRSQAECSTEEAFVLMHEEATMSTATMEEIIDAVVDGSIRFDGDPS